MHGSAVSKRRPFQSCTRNPSAYGSITAAIAPHPLTLIPPEFVTESGIMGECILPDGVFGEPDLMELLKLLSGQGRSEIGVRVAQDAGHAAFDAAA